MRAWVDINLEALRNNIAKVRNCIPTDIACMAVVKADAYGHGLVETAMAALASGCIWLGVATISEAQCLREAGVESDIALLAPPSPGDASDIISYNITAMVGQKETLDELARANRFSNETIGIHLDIETGMGRSGVMPCEALELWKFAVSLGFKVEGLTTHFADADDMLSTFHTRSQQSIFLATLAQLEANGANFKWIHVDNSAATLCYLDIPCNIVRLGALIYGMSPLTKQGAVVSNSDKLKTQGILPLDPVLTLSAKIAAVRNLPEGHSISYGAMHTLQRNSRVATVLLGYGDGYPRAVSCKGSVLVKGKRAPILGRVCMDQLVVDVTDIPDANAGDVAVCIGSQNSQSITVEEIAEQAGCIVHEITTGLTARLPRIYHLTDYPYIYAANHDE